MVSDNQKRSRDTTRIIIDPPTFSLPPEMRSGYLERRKGEIGMMLASAGEGDWKPVVNIANHVRGTGAMYGFDNIGQAAEELVKAVQNGDSKSFGYMEAYAKAVNESYV